MPNYFLVNRVADTSLLGDHIGELDKYIADGHQIVEILFYGQGAKEALLGSEQAKCWQAFSEKYSVPLKACANSALRYGVLDEALAKEEGAALSMSNAFQVTSLAVAFDQMAKAAHVCALGQWRDDASVNSTLAVIFNTLKKDSLVFKDGIDFLLLAASLDWQVTVIFQQEKCFDKPLQDLFALYEVLDVRFTCDGFNEKQFKLVMTF